MISILVSLCVGEAILVFLYYRRYKTAIAVLCDQGSYYFGEITQLQQEYWKLVKGHFNTIQTYNQENNVLLVELKQIILRKVNIANNPNQLPITEVPPGEGAYDEDTTIKETNE